MLLSEELGSSLRALPRPAEVDLRPRRSGCSRARLTLCMVTPTPPCARTESCAVSLRICSSLCSFSGRVGDPHI